MKTIQTIATVTDDRKLIVSVPADITPGEHQIVLVIEDSLASPPSTRTPKPPLKLNVWRWEAWSADCTFRREDLYGNEGR
jgi:hypothetical protein